MTLIDKEALLEKLSTFHPDYTFNITAFRNFVNAEPVIEQKKGKWKGRGFGDYECSICWEIASAKTKYCPHCGAIMEE